MEELSSKSSIGMRARTKDLTKSSGSRWTRRPASVLAKLLHEPDRRAQRDLGDAARRAAGRGHSRPVRPLTGPVNRGSTPMATSTHRLATRGSPLARLQAEHVGSALQTKPVPGIDLELVVVQTSGDQSTYRQPLSRSVDQGCS